MTDTTKLHLIYCCIVAILALLIVHFFNKPPAVITKTLTKVETQIKTVEKVVTRDRIVYRDRRIVTRKKDGDVITEIIHEHSTMNTVAATDSVTQTQSKVQSTTTETSLSRYSLGISFKPIHNKSLETKPTLDNSSIELGIRVLSLPIFATAGIEDSGKSFSIGVRYEW